MCEDQIAAQRFVLGRTAGLPITNLSSNRPAILRSKQEIENRTRKRQKTAGRAFESRTVDVMR